MCFYYLSFSTHSGHDHEKIIINVRIVDCQASSALAAPFRTTTFWHLLICLNVGSSFVWWWWRWWWRWWCEQCLRLCAIIIHPQFCHGQVCTAMEYTHKTLVMMMLIVMTQWFWLSAKALPIKLRGSCKINCRTDTKLTVLWLKTSFIWFFLVLSDEHSVVNTLWRGKPKSKVAWCCKGWLPWDQIYLWYFWSSVLTPFLAAAVPWTMEKYIVEECTLQQLVPPWLHTEWRSKNAESQGRLLPHANVNISGSTSEKAHIIIWLGFSMHRRPLACGGLLSSQLPHVTPDRKSK